MKKGPTPVLRLLVLPLGLLALAVPARAQLMLKGNIEAEITNVVTAGGASAVAKYATTPPGYNKVNAISHTGTGVLSSGLNLQGKKGSGSATLLYKPSSGTANALNAFDGIQSLDTLGLGSLKLTDTSLPSNGSVSFTWTVDFASLRVYNGATPVTSWFHDVPIISVPLTLSLTHTGNVAKLALAAQYNAATMFNSTITLDHGYSLALAPAVTLNTLITELSNGTFKATPNAPLTFGTIDVLPTIMSPVPEASTYALWAAVLLVAAVGYSRLRPARATPAAAA